MIIKKKKSQNTLGLVIILCAYYNIAYIRAGRRLGKTQSVVSGQVNVARRTIDSCSGIARVVVDETMQPHKRMFYNMYVCVCL